MNKRVLIVDDETNIRRMMRLTLEADGYEVEDAADALQGLNIFGDGSRFDVVLLDQKMPGLSGVEALQRLKRLAPHARVIMVTAFGSIELAVEAMKLGATDFLRKPLTPEMLRGALAGAVAKPPNALPSQPASATIPFEMPPVEIWTVNGFFIRSLPRAAGAATNDHLFGVRHAQRGPQGEVIVSINPSAVAKIDRFSDRPLTPAGAFWHQRAERALMNQLFRQAALPPDNHLTVDHVTDEEVALAREWTAD